MSKQEVVIGKAVYAFTVSSERLVIVGRLDGGVDAVCRDPAGRRFIVPASQLVAA